MATRTRAPLDSGLLNAPGGTFFKQLADGRWACFFMFGGRPVTDEILPGAESVYQAHILAMGTVLAGTSGFQLNRTIRAAHR
ncbi:MAG: hypothetical protein QF890_01620 [Myxococcota bacterium]|nr:hypothetical protein [bacterium]MDP6076015.1 hypothetical protein [Myxococcota bacterium]MDP6243483.1 hypothetical protein [Myxococcota bacterium]MDP7076519.1 hypothetical protein [Myxococcota bacterium]MDP7300973.1 hypothetical protein [Myxococcota bacterium]